MNNCYMCNHTFEEHNEKYFENQNNVFMCELCMSGFEEKKYKKDFAGESIKLLEDALKTLCECEISYGADDKVVEALKLLEELKKNEEQ